LKKSKVRCLALWHCLVLARAAGLLCTCCPAPPVHTRRVGHLPTCQASPADYAGSVLVHHDAGWSRNCMEEQVWEGSGNCDAPLCVAMFRECVTAVLAWALAMALWHQKHQRHRRMQGARSALQSCCCEWIVGLELMHHVQGCQYEYHMRYETIQYHMRII
jgi:hypothetical protein